MLNHVRLNPRISIDHLIQCMNSPKRRKIIALLANEPLSVSEIVGALGYDKADISQNLRMLRECGLVEYDRDKKRHVYFCTPHTSVACEDDCLSIKVATNKNTFVQVGYPASSLHGRSIRPIARSAVP